MSVYQIGHAVTRFFFRLFCPFRSYGTENIPEGGAVICANHSHNTDPFYVAYSFRSDDKINVIAKEEISRWPIIPYILKPFDLVIWIKRGKSDVGAIKESLRRLKKNEKLLIFPEGTRNEEIGEGKNGAAMLAIRTGQPLLPVYVDPERRRFHPVKVYFGKPYHPFTEDRRANSADYTIATEGLMARIRALKEQAEEVSACGK